MNLDDLRQLIDQEGGKIVGVESGKPILVVTSFDEYKKRFKISYPQLSLAGNDQRTEILPRELADEPLKIEDLPV